jgi:hypothetical protein
MSWPIEPPYYDREGAPISFRQWAELHRDVTYIVVRRTYVNENTEREVSVSTVWLGIDHAFGSGPPIIFETMTFGGAHDGEIFDRYPTELAAVAGHEQAVARERDEARRR